MAPVCFFRPEFFCSFFLVGDESFFVFFIHSLPSSRTAMPRGPRQHAPPGTAPSSAGCSIRLLFRRIRRCLRLIRCDLAAVRGMDSPSPPGLSDAARQQLILLVLEIAGSLHSVTVLPPLSDGDSTGSDEEPSYVYTAFMLFVTVRHFLD